MTTKELHGIHHELLFWSGFVKTKRFIDGWVGKQKTPELNDFVAEFILNKPNEKVLDVGSGAVSILNGLVPVTAVDPLGDLYRLVFDYKAHKIDSPLPYPAEELPFDGEFDIVHCSNAIDHTQNPIFAYHKLCKAVKPGGFVIVQGFANEGTFENWQGFHQNDISVENDTLILKNQQGDISVIDLGSDYHVSFGTEKTWFVWIKQIK